MKTKQKIQQWLLEAFAATLRVFLPTLAVKKFTLNAKGEQKAKMFCPGLEQEMKAIEKLKFQADDIKARQWSYETRLALLEEGNYALIERVDTEKELDILVQTQSPQIIAEALKGYQPKKNRLLKFMEAKELDYLKICEIIFLVPKVFNVLSVNDILALSVDRDVKWEYLNTLVLAESKVQKLHQWSLEVMQAFEKLYYPCEIDHINGVFSSAFGVALNKHSDISPQLSFLEKNYPNLYNIVWRNSADYGENIVPLVIERLPKVVDRLRDTKELSGDSDEQVWLSTAVSYLNKPEVMRVMLDCWDVIVRNCPSLEGKIAQKMAQDVVDMDVFHLAIAKVAEKYHPLFWKKLLVLTEKKLVSAAELNAFFPFVGWEENDAKWAIVSMIKDKVLSKDRIGELAENLRKYADDELEIEAEISVIMNNNSEEIMELVKNKLHTRAEIRLFTVNPVKNKEIIKSYIKKYKISDYTFEQLMRSNLDCDLMQEFIFDYASCGRMNYQNYKTLLRSKYAKVAMFVKGSVEDAPKPKNNL